MDWTAFLTAHNLIFTAFLVFGLGIWFLFGRRDGGLGIALGSFLMTASITALSVSFWLRAPDGWQAAFWFRSALAFGSFTPPILVLFAFALVKGRLPSIVWQSFLFLPSLALAWAAARRPDSGCGRDWLPGCLGGLDWTLCLHALLMFALAFAVVLAGRKRLIGRGRRALAVVLALTASFFAWMALISPLWPSPYAVWAGAAVLLLGSMALLAAAWHRRVKVSFRSIGIEVLVILALLAVAADLTLDRSQAGFALKLLVSLALVVYGVLAARRTVLEIGQVHRIRQLNAHLSEMNGHLLEADRAKTRLVSFASHQLRAPLGGLRSYLDMMLKGSFGPVNDRQREVLGTNLRVLSVMSETVETFLNAAKSEFGKLTVYRTETDLRDLAGEVVDSLRPVAEGKGLNLDMESFGRDFWVSCDRGKIRHALNNLLDNAIKYTESGQVTVRVVRERQAVRVEVSDSGIGLSAEDKAKLFRAFERGLAGIMVDAGGSGIGLYLTRKIAEAHGGRLTVDSAGPGKGAVFGLTLPV